RPTHVSFKRCCGILHLHSLPTRRSSDLETSRGDMDDDLVKAGDAGEPTAVFFKFLHVAFAVGGADDEDVVRCCIRRPFRLPKRPDRKSTRLNSSHQIISYAVFCLKNTNN